MAEIKVLNLTFAYEGSFDNVFEDVTFSIDTKWRLGFIGRNGKGKTTFLKLLLGNYEYQGKIISSQQFDYFPYVITEENKKRCAADFLEELKPGCETWRVICELEKLNLSAEILYQKFATLSFGEQNKVMLAVLFSGENDFLLIDEPTNHLDKEARDTVSEYLKNKKGFIIVSHDRDLLDSCIDHVLVLNLKSIDVQAGNFTTWWENKSRQDAFNLSENEKHLKEINKLKIASRQTKEWAKRNEDTKIGFDPIKEHDRCKATRAYIGAKTKKMQSRVKQMEKRSEREIKEKESLLQDIEKITDIKMTPLSYHKNVLIEAVDFGIKYDDKEIFKHFNIKVCQGDRIFLHGQNGCGKSSFLKAILDNYSNKQSQTQDGNYCTSGVIAISSGLVISYVNQDTSFLQGTIREYAVKQHLDEAVLFSVLRQLGMERIQFDKNIEEYSEGQKKKVLIAAGIITPAHLYVWDEPLNYIDVFSKMQIEKLLLEYKPTMIVVEHDQRFREKIATRIYEMSV